MGVDIRKKPPLPAPTESSTLPTSGDDTADTYLAPDLATDVSRRTDHTSVSIPEDGSPVTISTTKQRDKHGHTISRTNHPSQTSLLIEYFEGGKGPNVHSRPSVRVKVTPSSARKGKQSKDHIQITEANGARKPSYTRRISLGPRNVAETHVVEGDTKSVSSLAEDSNVSSRLPPIEIEVMHKDQGSDLSGTSLSKDNQYAAYNLSEISSMPPESMVEGNTVPFSTGRRESRSLARDETFAAGDTLKTPSRRRSRSLSKERITQKVMEKLSQDSPRRHKHGTKSRSTSISKEQVLDSTSSPKRTTKHRHSVDLPSADPSLLTASQISDARSFRSGTSKSSLNNPKLLETVEDAIRRLILPELTALKHEHKTQQNRLKFEQDRRNSGASASSASREDLTRRVSKHLSDPNIRGKPKVVLNRDEKNAGVTLSGDSIKRKKGRHEKAYDSPSERSFERGMSEETIIRDGGKDKKRSKDGLRLRDAVGGAIVGGLLTHAALRNHDSNDSLEKRERRRKRSKSHSRSHSRSASLVEAEEIFHKHDVPPMPMRSEITSSDMTRESLLSERTSTPTSERRRAEIREVARGSPKEIYSPASRTPTRSPRGPHPLESYQTNGLHEEDEFHHEKDYVDEGHLEDKHYFENAVLAGAATGAGVMGAHYVSDLNSSREGMRYEHGRGLSPIQSVASFEEQSEVHHREPLPHAHSTGSISSAGKPHEKEERRLSLQSYSSGASAEHYRTDRPMGISLESGSEILATHQFKDSNVELSRDLKNDSWYEGGADEHGHYRDSTGDDSYRDSLVDARHLTNYTDDSMDAPHLDKVTAAQQIRGIGANPEYVHTPLAVESAVASLHDPSVLDVHSTRSGRSRLGESFLDSPAGSDLQQDEYGRKVDNLFAENSPSKHQYAEPNSPLKHHYDEYASPTRSQHENLGSPLKHQYEEHEQGLRDVPANVYNQHSAANSPRHSIARSLASRDSFVPKMTARADPVADDPMPEIIPGMDSRSDISTNPPDIQGPRGGPPFETPLQWPYQKEASSEKAEALARSSNASAHESLKAAAANMLSAAASAGAAAALRQRERHSKEQFEHTETRELQDHSSAFEQTYHSEKATNYQYPYINEGIPTPLDQKDEGYDTEHPNARSIGALTPDHRANGVELFPSGDVGVGGMLLGNDDPFVGGHARPMSGNSHGMASPLYDSATGRGIDRIQSKDVVALMDHLTVRDAQRNARDTEILVTLVRSAAEMRNSFEDMKRFIAEQDEMLVAVGNKQHEKTQKIIGGPRPQPAMAPRTPRRTSAEDDMMDDVPTKRRNVFRRALKGLSGRNANDITKIEDMLNHLLDEVADLKAGQDVRPVTSTQRGNGLTSYENLRDAPQDDYELDGRIGTSSTGNHSGYFAAPSNRQAAQQQNFERRRGSQNRVSTVLEADEDEDAPLEAHEQNVLDYENTEHMVTPTREMPRGGSVPLATPPAIHQPIATQSNENTPRTEKSRKHKSSSSSFFPKISRWSKTTASTNADNARGAGPASNRKERPFSGISHSGSDLHGAYEGNDHYDPQGDDRLRSSTSLDNGANNNANARDMNDEDYDRPPSPLIPSHVSEKPAYRAHRDSLNLQHPRPRHGPGAQYENLESQIQNLSSPISPTSDQFGSNPMLSRYVATTGNRNSGIRSGALSPISDAGYSDVSAAKSGPPRPPKIRDDGPLIPPKVPMEGGAATARKPTFAERAVPGGPRPIATSGNYSPDAVSHVQRKRYRGSPNPMSEASEEDVTF